MGAADRVGAGLGQADVPDVSLVDQLRDRADGLLDRNPGIDARRPIDVDVVAAEAAERVGEEVRDRGGPAIASAPAAVRAAERAELDADHDVLASAAAERIADEQLVVAHPVEVTGVEQRDPGVERGVDRRDALPPPRPGRTRPTSPCSPAREPRRRARQFRAYECPRSCVYQLGTEP